MIHIDTLNSKYAGFLTKWISPFEIKACPVTTIPENVGAFAINKNGFDLKRVEASTTSEGGLVVIAFIPYDIAEKFEDYDTGIKYLSIYQNAMLKELALLKRDISKATFLRPGMSSKFFLDCEDRAALELRCFIRD